MIYREGADSEMGMTLSGGSALLQEQEVHIPRDDYQIDIDQESTVILPGILDDPMLEWVTARHSQHLPAPPLPHFPEKVRPEQRLEWSGVLSGNMCADRDRLVATYYELGITVNRQLWIDEQLTLARERLDTMMIGKMGLDSYAISPHSEQPIFTDTAGTGCLTFGDDSPTLGIVSPRQRMVGLIRVSDAITRECLEKSNQTNPPTGSIQDGHVYNMFRQMAKDGVNIKNALIFTGPHLHDFPEIPFMRERVEDELRAAGVPKAQITFGEDTKGNSHFFSRQSKFRRIPNTLAIGIKKFTK